MNITKVSDAGEQVWGVVLLDEEGNAILRSLKGVRKGEVMAMAKALKFEGAGAPVSVENKPGDGHGPVWIIEKTDQGWAVRFTEVAATSFDLLLKAEDAAGPPKAAEEAVAEVKTCLEKAEIKWEPPTADPAYQEKVTDETDIEGLEGSGRLSTAMREQVDEVLNCKVIQIPALEGPVLLILDYSPSAGERPLSIALDCECGAKCWMTAPKVRVIGDQAPNPYEDYKAFTWEEREFKPYSIQPLPESIFDDVDALVGVCRRLYRHALWD